MNVRVTELTVNNPYIYEETIRNARKCETEHASYKMVISKEDYEFFKLLGINAKEYLNDTYFVFVHPALWMEESEFLKRSDIEEITFCVLEGKSKYDPSGVHRSICFDRKGIRYTSLEAEQERLAKMSR